MGTATEVASKKQKPLLCSWAGAKKREGAEKKRKRERYESQCLWTAALCHQVCVGHFMELLWFHYSILTRWWDILVFTMTHKYPKSHSAAAFSYSNSSLSYPSTYQCCICRKLSEQFSCFLKHRYSLQSHFYGLKLKMLSSESWMTTFHIWQQLVSAASMRLT